MKKYLTIKTVVATGIGAALFIILKRFVSIPTAIPNTNIDTSYGLLAFFALLFGPVAGFLIGFIGHLLNDIMMYGSPWISWVISSGITGLGIGLLWKKIDLSEGKFGLKEITVFNIAQVLVNAVAWFLVAPSLDILIYAEPANKVFVQGLVAGGLNMISTGVLGTLLILAYAKTRTKKGSLNKEL